MITRLFVSNYALIEQLEVDFKSGLTIITGETGAGKSIILGALSLILGGRADSAAIRNLEKKTIVEASFNIEGNESIRQQLIDADIDLSEPENEIIVRREIAANGRSRVFINDCVTAVATLREIMSQLVDIHSQHNNMLLAQPSFQLTMLDELAKDDHLIGDYKVQYTKYIAAKSELDEFNQMYDRSIADLEYLTFQYNQLDRMMLRENEDIELEQQQQVLSNAGEIREALWTVESLLNGEDKSIIADLGIIASTLDRVNSHLPDVDGMGERVREALVELKDISQSVGQISNTITDDPARLQLIEDRQNEIYSALRKFNVSTVNELIDLRDEYQKRLDAIQNFDDRHEELEQQLEKEEQQARQLASKISDSRQKAARHFVEQLKPLAHSLGMKNLQFEVEFTEVQLCATGSDAVQFKFAFNKNQQLMPVKDTASGGEISRLMLCIKSVIAKTMNLPTIIFDEIDTGVSGEIAAKMGQMMSDIAEHIQVVAITHLPQVAARGDHHLRVYKRDTENETITSLEVLDPQQHLEEVARMLSAGTIDEAALANARSLINDRFRI